MAGHLQFPPFYVVASRASHSRNLPQASITAALEAALRLWKSDYRKIRIMDIEHDRVWHYRVGDELLATHRFVERNPRWKSLS